MSVPDDIAITGYDDAFVAAIRQVSLTSVNADSAGIGELAARCLIQRIADPTHRRSDTSTRATSAGASTGHQVQLIRAVVCPTDDPLRRFADEYGEAAGRRGTTDSFGWRQGSLDRRALRHRRRRRIPVRG